MASLDFPSGPTPGQSYVSGGRTWVWDGTSWNGTAAVTISGPSGPTGSTGADGVSGYSGRSGYSGSGVSGYSGATGLSGTSGTSGATGSQGLSGYSGQSGTSGFSGLGYASITSSDNMVASLGSRSFNVNQVNALTTGARIRVAAVASPNTAYFDGNITSISGNTVFMTSDNATGGSTYGSWTVSIVGAVGASGYSGIAGAGLTAGSASVGYINYNGTTKTAGQMDGGTTAPTNTTRLNFDGYLYATRFYGDGSQLSGVSAGATITDDTTTNGTRYLLWEDATSGSATTVGVSSTKLYFNPSTGTLYATQFTSLSDASKKTNIATISNAADTVNQMRGVSFDWLDTGAHAYGVIAQELEQIVPEAVVENAGVKSVNYNMIIAFLIESNKELAARVSALEGR